jgi:hypothetical protein
MISQTPIKPQHNSPSHWFFVPSAISATAGVVIGLIIGNFLGLI